MRVSELIAQLQELPPDLPVLTAIDPEGNGFRNMQDVELASYDPSDMELGTYDDSDPDYICYDTKCVVIWP